MSERVIIRDPRGRTVSVPSDNIPKGSTIIGKDVLPGQSAATAEVNVSEVKNPEKVATPPPADETDVAKTDAIETEESEEPANPRKKR